MKSLQKKGYLNLPPRQHLKNKDSQLSKNSLLDLSKRINNLSCRIRKSGRKIKGIQN